MSHVTGTVQTLAPALTVGPDSGAPASSPGVWALDVDHAPAPGGTKLLILHFRAVSLPAGNRLEVDLGYGTDVFTAADGADLWTRPIDVRAFAGGRVPIRYVASGAAAGSAQLFELARGERHAGEQDPTSLSNCDPFLGDATYQEPKYDPYWFCAPPPQWQNVACLPAGDIRAVVARSAGMITHVHAGHLSTCSATLVGPDLILTAGHCLERPDEELRSCSVTFDYQTTCDGSRPPGYAPRFHKVVEKVAWRYDSGFDYCLLRIATPPGGIGVPPIQMRHDVPAGGERVFNVHHPNGAVKKVSPPQGMDVVFSSDSAGVRVGPAFHVSGGSSGSGLFDMAGRVLGILSNGNPCGRGSPPPPPSALRWFPTATMLTDIASATAPPATRDVMVVIDRSGSMSLPGGSGRSKIEEARDAVSLFVQLVRAGAGNRVGLVSFSTAASAPADRPIAQLTQAARDALIGPAPYSGGVVGGLVPDGMTSIGGGLEAARLQFPAPGVNPRSILLLTDGLQNTPPMVGDVEGALSGIDVDVIGYGTPSSLDGALLTALAQAHGGRYARADTNLQLEKYFAQAFGNIFEAGLLMDPEGVLPSGQDAAPPVTFAVCGETTATIVVGWDRADAPLAARVTTPGGAAVVAGAPGVEGAFGRTWAFLRVGLPHQGERDGQWTVAVVRQGLGGEFPPPAVDVRYFVNVVAAGGPRLARADDRRVHYTGDAINPLVLLQDPGGAPENAAVELTVERPDAGVGNILTESGLRPPVTRQGDTIPARQATLLELEAEGRAPVGHTAEIVTLHDDPASADGAFEAAGLFGHPLPDLLTVEGDYRFRARATYGAACAGVRELAWSLHVDVGIDAAASGVTTTTGAARADGTRDAEVRIVPRDRYGNHVGPGRADAISVTGGAGTTPSGPARDNGDGSYTVPAVWDPSVSAAPGIVVGQPGRPPVVLQEPGAAGAPGCSRWLLLLALALIVVLAVLLAIALATS
jgi:hypothetical protein